MIHYIGLVRKDVATAALPLNFPCNDLYQFYCIMYSEKVEVLPLLTV